MASPEPTANPTPAQDPSAAPVVHPFDALATIACVYLALLTFGFAAFRYLATLPVGASRNPDRTFFTSANAVSLTGFAQATSAVRDYPALGQIVLSALAVGGALTTLVGGGYLFARAMRWPISLPRLALGSLAIVAVPVAAGPFVGSFDALSAATGLGLSTGQSRGPIARAVLVGLSVPGVLGVLPLLALARPRRDLGRPDYVAATTSAVALLVVAGAGVLALVSTPWFVTATQSLNLRAFGLGGPAVNVTSALPWATAGLVLLGAAPAGLAGGLGVLPIVVLLRGGWDAARRRPVDPLLGVAIAWVIAFVVIAAATLLVLASIEPAVPGDRLMLIACAALGNVGVSHEPIGLTKGTLFVLSATMLIGRLLPLVMLAWMACAAERQDRGDT